MKPMPAKLITALVVLAAACLAAGCGNGSLTSALSSAAASRSIGGLRAHDLAAGATADPGNPMTRPVVCGHGVD